MKKIKLNLRAIVTAILFGVLLCCTISTICLNIKKYNVYASENNYAVNEIKSIDNSLLVVLNEEISDINKVHSFDYFKGVEISEIIDLTERKINFEIGEHFCQVLQIYLKDDSEEYVLQAIDKLKQLSGIVSVERNLPIETAATPDDVLNNQQWNKDEVNGINLEQAWDVKTGNNNVRVGVMDTGIAKHPDLNVNLAEGFDFYNDNSITDDDDSGHGTHVAGIIGAVGNNGNGVAGINWNVTLVPLQISYYDSEQNDYFYDPISVARAIVWATDKWNTNERVGVLNFSFGGFGANEFIKNLVANYPGLFVWSAGNFGINVDSYSGIENYKLNNLFAVGSIDSNGLRSEFSNYGKSSVDIFAPGGDILSTYPESFCTGEIRQTRWGDLLACECEWSTQYVAEGEWVPNGTTHIANGYHKMSGTSMAAPHVAGVAALMLSVNPNLTGAELKESILNTADDITITTPDGTQNVKKLNAFEAVASAVENHSTYIRYNINTLKPFTTPINFEYIEWGVASYLADGNRYRVEGYEFVGWSFTRGTFVDGVGTVGAEVAYTSRQSIKYFLPMTNDVTIYAVWKVKSWTIIEYQNNEKIGEHEMHYDGSSMTFTARDITGYNFVKWQKQYNNTPNYTFVSSDKTITLNPNDNMPPQGWSFYFLAAVYEQACIEEGSLITLADGSQRAVEDLAGNENLLVWNLYTGSYDVAPIMFIDSHSPATYNVTTLTFSDGTEVNVIDEHAFWDVGLNKYVYLRSDADKYIGHTFKKSANGNLENVELVSVENREKQTVAYSPVTYGHLCYFVNGMLSMPGGIEGLFNIFEVDGETMAYNAEAMQRDIEEYGLYTYEEFCEVAPVTEEAFEAFNGQYLKVAIGKGLITPEKIYDLAVRYGMLE